MRRNKAKEKRRILSARDGVGMATSSLVVPNDRLNFLNENLIVPEFCRECQMVRDRTR